MECGPRMTEDESKCLLADIEMNRNSTLNNMAGVVGRHSLVLSQVWKIISYENISHNLVMGWPVAMREKNLTYNILFTTIATVL